MVEGRKKMHQEIISEFSSADSQFLKSRIPYSANIEKMGVYREPVVKKYPSGSYSKCYVALWKEIKSIVFKNNTFE